MIPCCCVVLSTQADHVTESSIGYLLSSILSVVASIFYRLSSRIYLLVSFFELLSSIVYLLFYMVCRLSSVFCLPSYAFDFLLSSVFCLLPRAFCLLHWILCLLSSVFQLLSSVVCLRSVCALERLFLHDRTTKDGFYRRGVRQSLSSEASTARTVLKIHPSKSHDLRKCRPFFACNIVEAKESARRSDHVSRLTHKLME